jgi:hypothetical protein
MTLSRDEVMTGIIDELDTFERLVRSLSDGSCSSRAGARAGPRATSPRT